MIAWLLVAAEAIEKLTALIGSVMLARPFFRGERRKVVIEATKDAKPSDADAERAKQASLQRLLERASRLEPCDLRDAQYGVGLLGFSFTLGLLLVLIKNWPG